MFRRSIPAPRRTRSATVGRSAGCRIEPLEERQLLTTYYVSLAGRDTNSGTSTSAPWATINRVNSASLKAGDSVLFQGGSTFSGSTLYINPAERGNSSSPIRIGSYGTGRATLRPASNRGAIYVYNTGGISISNLNFVGTGTGTGATATTGGIFFYNDRSDSLHFSYIRVDQVDASKFRYGFELGGGGVGSSAGFDDVRVTNAKLHDNERAGLFTFAKSRNVHKSIYVGHVSAYNNTGVPGLYAIDKSVTGHGIVLGNVNGATVERSVAHDNGKTGDGGAGIWTYSSTKVTFQYCESYNNHTSSTHDGDGFDLDQDVSWSTIQYCYSHGNDGGGYLLSHRFDDYLHSNNVVRYNVSAYDGRKNNYGAIHLWGRVRYAEIYNNTVYLPYSSTGTHSAVRIHNSGLNTSQDVYKVHFRNNVFVTTGGTPLILITPDQLSGSTDLKFQGNAYYSSGSSFKINWGNSTITSLTSFRNIGQEKNGSTSLGYSGDPKLTTPTTVQTIGNADNLKNLTSYRLASGSPVINKGLNLSSLFGVSMGTKDFWGHTTPVSGAYDIGAYDA